MKKLVVALMLIVSNSVLAARVISCDYNNQLSNFEFSLNDFNKGSFNKEFSVKEKNYKIFVKNIDATSEVEDFLTITSKQYTMTYSLDCKLRGTDVATTAQIGN